MCFNLKLACFLCVCVFFFFLYLFFRWFCSLGIWFIRMCIHTQQFDFGVFVRPYSLKHIQARAHASANYKNRSVVCLRVYLVCALVQWIERYSINSTLYLYTVNSVNTHKVREWSIFVINSCWWFLHFPSNASDDFRLLQLIHSQCHSVRWDEYWPISDVRLSMGCWKFETANQIKMHEKIQ